MKKLYIVEVTSNETWEICSGFYFVMAENVDEAKQLTKIEKPYYTVLSVKDVKKLMDKKTFEIIIDPQIE